VYSFTPPPHPQIGNTEDRRIPNVLQDVSYT
jgi:hypothetical protein